jgi:group I intron endonuclease
MSGFVYLWKNYKNNKMYLGSHLGKTNDGYVGSGVYFKRAYNKNPENFKRIILYTGSNFIEIEDFLLKFFDAANNDSFYNLKNDAIGGWEHCNTKEIKEKRGLSLSKAKKGKAPVCSSRDKSGINNPMYGKKHSNITKQKISEKRSGIANRKIPVIEITSGMYFEKVNDAAEYYGITSSTMSALIKNKRITKGKCKNKIFNYV